MKAAPIASNKVVINIGDIDNNELNIKSANFSESKF